MGVSGERTVRTIHLVSIAAPFRANYSDMKRPPSAILYVGGYLKQHGFKVAVHHIRHYDVDKTIEKILQGIPLFVGLSMLTGAQVTYSAEFSKKLKAENPQVPVVWGGIHPSLMPQECMKNDNVDYLVIGEGEITIVELARHIAEPETGAIESIEGIAYRKGNDVEITPQRKINKHIDEFRQDWTLVNPRDYVKEHKGEKLFYFISSRGCPHSCAFCYNQKFNQRRWRGHSVEFVVQELVKLKEQTGLTTVMFDDDNFFTNKKRGLRLIRELSEHGIRVAWLEIRVDYITDELIGEIVENGVEGIFVGWESGSDATLSKIAKGFSRDLILQKTRILAKHKSLTTKASSIVGFPWESPKDIDETIDLALKMFRINPFRLEFNIGIYVPYPGAPITAEATARGFEFPKDFEAWSSFDILSGSMRLPWLTDEQVREYTIVDKYTKLLIIYPKSSKLVKAIRFVFAIIAYVRLKSRVFALPFELLLTDLYFKREWKQLEKS